MGHLSLSEKYAVGAAIVLLFAALLNNAIFTLGIGILGLVVGLIVARGTTLTRAAIVGLVGFAVAAVLGAAIVLRGIL